MTAPKELRFSHNFDSEATKKTAQRRAYELSKPGAVVSMAAYINKLIEADGKKHQAKA